MKIVKKLIVALMIATVSVSSVFAEEKKNSNDGLGKYVKLTLGYSRGGVDTEWDFDSYKISYALAYSGFEIVPTFGLELPISALEKKNMSLALEGSVGLTFGGDSDGLWESSTTVIAPGVMGILNYHFDSLPKFSSYVGLGFSVPIQIVNVKYEYTTVDYTTMYGQQIPSGTKTETYETDSTVVGFKINTAFGAKYDFTDKFSALGEFGMGIIGVFSWSIRAGAIYHF
ncbi:MAG: hypothetical protein IJ158_11855 [Treponema sp.]|nr:hypothetical protein [Treponema sp.]